MAINDWRKAFDDYLQSPTISGTFVYFIFFNSYTPLNIKDSISWQWQYTVCLSFSPQFVKMLCLFDLSFQLHCNFLKGTEQGSFNL